MTVAEYEAYTTSGDLEEDVDISSEYWYVLFAKPDEEFGYLIALSAQEYTQADMLGFVSGLAYQA